MEQGNACHSRSVLTAANEGPIIGSVVGTNATQVTLLVTRSAVVLTEDRKCASSQSRASKLIHHLYF